MNEPIRIAFPKGRLFDQIRAYFHERGIRIDFGGRRLVAADPTHGLEFLLVKNSDLPTYVNHGIAALGICGDDVVYESGHRFFKVKEFPFGSTRMCLAARSNYQPDEDTRHLTVATKFPRFARHVFHSRGIPVKIVKLDGSVELAPVLGLAQYIVDLVETGSTLKANDLAVVEELAVMRVHLIANPASYKLRYEAVQALVRML